MEEKNEKNAGKALVVRGTRTRVPAMISNVGQGAAKRFIEFFTANIRNRNTRASYARAVAEFFAWCERVGLHELAHIEPTHVAAYVEQLQREHSA